MLTGPKMEISFKPDRNKERTTISSRCRSMLLWPTCLPMSVLTVKYLTLNHTKPQLCGLHWRRPFAVLTWIGCKFFTLYAYLTKKFAILHNLTLIWVFTESEHGKGLMDGVGASIKNGIDNAIAFNPNSVITCASELWEFLPKDNKQIGMYSEEDVQRYKEMLLSDLKIAFKSFGISSIHEIKFSWRSA